MSLPIEQSNISLPIEICIMILKMRTNMILRERSKKWLPIHTELLNIIKPYHLIKGIYNGWLQTPFFTTTNNEKWCRSQIVCWGYWDLSVNDIGWDLKWFRMGKAYGTYGEKDLYFLGWRPPWDNYHTNQCFYCCSSSEKVNVIHKYK